MDPARSTYSGGRVLGPKDWIPDLKSSGLLMDFLSKEDRLRFDKIKESRKGGGQVPSGETEWLIQALDRLSISRRIDDYIFPDYVALHNPISGGTYALRFDGRSDLGMQRTVVAGAPTEILSRTLECRQSDAYFVVRPVIQVLKADPVDLEKFLDSTLVVSIDGLVVIRESFRLHTAPLDGKAPFRFRSPVENLFPAYAVRSYDYDRGGVQADASCMLGLFLPNQSRVVATVMHGDYRIQGPVLVKAWILGALYTTRAAGQAV